MKVGELKRFIKDLPDDWEVLTRTSLFVDCANRLDSMHTARAYQQCHSSASLVTSKGSRVTGKPKTLKSHNAIVLSQVPML